MNNTILYSSMLVVVLLWSFTPFLRKLLLKKLSSFDFYIVTQMMIMIYLFITLGIMKAKNIETNLPSVFNLDNREKLIFLLASGATFFSSIALINLLKYNEATQIMPQLQPLVIILTIIIGMCLFGEKVNNMEKLGILFIVIGVILVNKFKDKK